MIHHEIDVLIKDPDLPRFVITEIAQQPDRLFQLGQKMGINPRQFIKTFEDQIEHEVRNGKIRPVTGRQVLMNVMSLCIYPFVAKPIVKALMQLDEKSFSEMMEARKKDNYEFIVNALTP